jgi:uncharacterized protein (DUF2141 family)
MINSSLHRFSLPLKHFFSAKKPNGLVKKNPILDRFLYVLAACVLVFSFSRCANMARPTGGPKDTLPPNLLKASPEEFSTGIAPKTIVFDFDEYVELKDVQQNLIVSPTIKGIPIVTRKLKQITVKIKDTLDANTTYALQFGNAIVDLNEGNPFGNFTYVFSTGNSLDSLSLSGRVILAEDGRTDSTLLVMLHRNMDDSAVVKEKPRYYTRLNKEGYFNFQYLAPGRYKLYALKDESGQLRYNRKDQLFAHHPITIETSTNNENIVLFAYQEEKEEKEKKPSTNNNRNNRNRKKEEDTTLLKPNISVKNGAQDLLGNLTITFESPLESIVDNAILITDTLGAVLPNLKPKILIDSNRTLVTVEANWPAGTPLQLILKEGAFTDSLGAFSRLDTIPFSTKQEKDYGSLTLRFTNFDPTVDTTPLVLQFIQNDKITHSIPVKKEPFYARLFPPGEYQIRLLFDDNNNGKWDPGSFFENKKQPEIVKFYDKKLTIRANWENEQNVEL